MSHSQPQMLIEVVDKTTGLSDLQHHVLMLAQLEEKITHLLPPNLNKHIRVANYRQNILILQASSASWLTRLKYEQSKILSELRQNILPGLSSIQYQIAPNMVNMAHTNRAKEPVSNSPVRIMTKESAAILSNLAEQAPASLKKQLLKLANHAK